MHSHQRRRAVRGLDQGNRDLVVVCDLAGGPALGLSLGLASLVSGFLRPRGCLTTRGAAYVLILLGCSLIICVTH